jgi:hypothetical protein
VLVVLHDPGFSGAASLNNANLTIFTGYVVYAWSLESQVILHSQRKLVTILSGRSEDLLLDSIWLMQFKVM